MDETAAAARRPWKAEARTTESGGPNPPQTWATVPWSAPSSLQLIQAISEELGAGLSSVMSAREVLLDPRPSQVNIEATRQVLAIMARGITRLGAVSQIVRDLIDIADLQQGRATVTLSRYDVRQVVHRAVEEVSTLAALYPTSFEVNLEGGGQSVTVDVPRIRRAILHILGYCQRTVSAAEVVSISGRPVQAAYEITIQPRRGTRPDQGARARVQQVVREEASEALERRGRYVSLLVAHGYIAACGGQLRLDASEAGLRSVTCTLPLSPVTP